MNTAAIVTALVIVAIGARAEETRPMHSALNDAKVIAAMRTAWQLTGNGSSRIEAAFRLDGSPENYEVIPAPMTNEIMNQNVQIIPGRTFAVFHVHPSVADPLPSRQDKKAADRFQVKILTMHRYGLYEYDPVTRRTTMIRNGTQWLNPLTK
jgi:hypothetical protein